MNPALGAAIGEQLGAPLTETTALGRGFTDNWRGRAGGRHLFLKTSPDFDRLAAEADGLGALADCPAVRCPAVLALGRAAGVAFLALEWLDIATDGDQARLGAALAELHERRGEAYGWGRDNYLGATPQDNRPASDWAEFFATRRLAPQLSLAQDRGCAAVAAPGQALLARLPALLAGHRPPPALLHGDLWRGNAGFAQGHPCLYDPAVHFGDPECDLAMAALFGGFSREFFAAYGACRPPLPGWPVRRRLYQLYHQLNHLNLFGAAYLPQVLRTMEELP